VLVVWPASMGLRGDGAGQVQARASPQSLPHADLRHECSGPRRWPNRAVASRQHTTPYHPTSPHHTTPHPTRPPSDATPSPEEEPGQRPLPAELPPVLLPLQLAAEKPLAAKPCGGVAEEAGPKENMLAGREAEAAEKEAPKAWVARSRVGMLLATERAAPAAHGWVGSGCWVCGGGMLANLRACMRALMQACGAATNPWH